MRPRYLIALVFVYTWTTASILLGIEINRHLTKQADADQAMQDECAEVKKPYVLPWLRPYEPRDFPDGADL